MWLLLEGELLEVDGGLLVFDVDEVVELFCLYGCSVDVVMVGILLECSGGWCVVLCLCLLVGEEMVGLLL